jgi:hypothetical protein
LVTQGPYECRYIEVGQHASIESTNPDPFAALVPGARAVDPAACVRLVELTQQMAYGVAWQVLRREPDARDAVQEAYVRAFSTPPRARSARGVRRLVAAHRRHGGARVRIHANPFAFAELAIRRPANSQDATPSAPGLPEAGLRSWHTVC